MEYVEIRFPHTRTVYIDGVENGETNKVLRVGGGTHAFDLGSPKNYLPDELVIQVTNTDPLSPLIIQFDEV